MRIPPPLPAAFPGGCSRPASRATLDKAQSRARKPRRNLPEEKLRIIEQERWMRTHGLQQPPNIPLTGLSNVDAEERHGQIRARQQAAASHEARAKVTDAINAHHVVLRNEEEDDKNAGRDLKREHSLEYQLLLGFDQPLSHAPLDPLPETVAEDGASQSPLQPPLVTPSRKRQEYLNVKRALEDVEQLSAEVRTIRSEQMLSARGAPALEAPHGSSMDQTAGSPRHGARHVGRRDGKRYVSARPFGSRVRLGAAEGVVRMGARGAETDGAEDARDVLAVPFSKASTTQLRAPFATRVVPDASYGEAVRKAALASFQDLAAAGRYHLRGLEGVESRGPSPGPSSNRSPAFGRRSPKRSGGASSFEVLTGPSQLGHPFFRGLRASHSLPALPSREQVTATCGEETEIRGRKRQPRHGAHGEHRSQLEAYLR